MSGLKTRAAALSVAVALLGSTAGVAPALAHNGFGLGKVNAAGKAANALERLRTFLSGLVANGTITQVQADAILAAKKTDLDARVAKVVEFQTRAKPIIAAAYNLSVADYEAKAANHTLPKLTADQRKALKAALDELAKSLGLDHAPLGKAWKKRH